MDDGKKYCLRTFFLSIGDGRTYVYNDSLGYIHHVKYDPTCTDFHSHVSHYRPWLNEKDQRKYFLLSNEPWSKQVQANVEASSREFSLLWSDTVAKSREQGTPTALGPKHYQIWGADFLVMEDFSVSMIEVRANPVGNPEVIWLYLMWNWLQMNAFPNLNHNALRAGATADQGSAFEMQFRNNGFDRDLMRVIGLPQGDCPTDHPQTWVDITHPSAAKLEGFPRSS